MHWSSGSVPAVAFEQVPAAFAQVRQVPEQTVEQQVPCAQIPELHSPPAVQVDPLGLLPQLVPTQMLGEAQSPVPPHIVLQILAVVSQPYGSQSDEVTVRQTPAPSHVRGGVSVEPTQVPATQVVPFAWSWQAPAPSHVPVVPQVEAAVTAHWLATAGGSPTATLLQVPLLAASAHDLQSPVQPLEQQTPCWQKPELHSAAVAQGSPSGRLVQTPALQMLGDTQSASAVQVTLQETVVLSHWNAPHEVPVWVAQVPVPLQSRGAVKVAAVQVAAAHCVPATCLRQPPMPSQAPSSPQVEAAAARHWLAVSGGDPAPIGEQVPTLVGKAHDRQVPVQAELQQTFWAQNVELHSAFCAHEAPIGFLPQLLAASQLLGARQSALLAQVVLQAPVPQRNGSQGAIAGGRQSPEPSQVRACVSVEPVQLAATHCVPLGCCRQAPAPLQVPSLPQVAAAAATHWLATTGGLPMPTGEQVPTVPAMLQARQVPEQAASQQTCCSQWFDLHSDPAAQAAPFDFLSQIVPVQM